MRLKSSMYAVLAGLLILLAGAVFVQSGLSAGSSAGSSEISADNLPGSVLTVELTPEEKAFLSSRKIRLGVDAARPPFEYVDEKGVYSGISAGFMKVCAKRLGIEIVPVSGLNVKEAMSKIKAGEIDVIPKITPTPERAKQLSFTKPYATFPSVIITRKDARFVGGLDDLDGLKVGVLKGLVVQELLTRDYPKLPLILLPDVRTALLELSTGKFDVFIDNLGTVSYNIEKLGLTNLKIAAPTPYNHDLAFGVRKDWPLLASALDKALAGMTNEEKTNIKSQWLTVEYHVGVNWKIVGPIAAALLVVIIFILIWNRRLSRAVGEREAAQRELQASALELAKHSTVKSQIAEISAALQKAVTYEELAHLLLSNAAPLLGAAYGMLYIFDADEKRLKSAGGYGCTVRDISFAVGQGLVGQCALEKTSIAVNLQSDSDDSGVCVNWGAGESPPKAIFIDPIMQSGALLGVLELASMTSFGFDGMLLLDELIPIIAMNIEILNRNLHTVTLLEKTQQLADKLKSQQNLLKETEVWYRDIIESAPDAMMVIHRLGNIILTNSTAEKIFGYERDELIGEHVDILVPDAVRPQHAEKCDGFFKSNKMRQYGDVHGVNLTGVRKDGSEFPVEVRLSFLREDASREVCVCASIRDITEKKRAEDELKRH